MQFSDASLVAGTRRREDGSLLADVRIARTGVQTYLGAEVGKPDVPIVRVYRPGSEVFSRDTVSSAAHRPVTNDHPPTMVDSTNWKQFAVGQTADEVAGEGIFLRVPLMVSDGAAIRDIEAGKREVSAGYTCDLDWTAGMTSAGEAYDAIQKNIRLNHVAIVARGRAGSQVRIGDGAPDGGKDRASWGAAPITDEAASKEGPMAAELRKVMVDGLQVETTDAGSAAIDKLTKDRDSAKDALANAEKAHGTALAAKDADIARLTAEHKTAIEKKDAELAAKDAAIDAEKAKVLSDADLDKRVTDRADLISKAKAIAKDVQTTGLSDAAIRKAVVVAKLGDAAVKDKSEAYIDARFDILADGATAADPFRETVRGGIQPTNDSAAPTKAYGEMVTNLQDAWKNPQKGAA